MCSTFDYTFYQFPQKTEGNTMVNLITLHACPVHTIHILSPDSEKSKTDYHIPLWSFWRTVTHQYFNMNMQIYLKNTTNL